MFETFAALFGLSVAVTTVVTVVASVLGVLVLPLLFVWMLIDALVRPEARYPSASSNEKLLWILLMLVMQWPAVLYFFMVVWPMRRSATPSAAYTVAAPAA
ncbi:MAG: hypothetical protein Q7W30_08160 [Coriobacteriia bacterium]|nr:hypothetical protein [Coriobacteriia bacterium]